MKYLMLTDEQYTVMLECLEDAKKHNDSLKSAWESIPERLAEIDNDLTSSIKVLREQGEKPARTPPQITDWDKAHSTGEAIGRVVEESESLKIVVFDTHVQIHRVIDHVWRALYVSRMEAESFGLW